ncbi:S66 family peptidase [Anaerosporobacter faecicola]|uniref:S66 family peptidase n=1 Tax=Anaerosporobacter faecicola TaxID=2718714 RepID=UPI00143A5888|nr:S66 peptidase family protein [Anaerosporobacter faecicola]
MKSKEYKIGITCCSNGQKRTYQTKIKELEDTLHRIGIQPIFSDCIYEEDTYISASAKKRADAIMKLYKSEEIDAIFDISGGDLANGILPYLDYEVIKNSAKMFWGYSDLTTVMNAIYTKTRKASVLYQLRNLIYDYKEEQISNFTNTFIDGGNQLLKMEYQFIQNNRMRGIVVGGNIRCFLKLAGTEYMPDLSDKILLLESYGGAPYLIETYLCQLQQIGAFDKIAGIILGTFTQMETENYVPSVQTLVKKFVRNDLPIAVTREIGHGTDAKGIVIGQELILE